MRHEQIWEKKGTISVKKGGCSAMPGCHWNCLTSTNDFYYNKFTFLVQMQQLELAQMEHRDANLAALAALGPRKRKPLEASGSGPNQVLSSTQAPLCVMSVRECDCVSDNQVWYVWIFQYQFQCFCWGKDLQSCKSFYTRTALQSTWHSFSFGFVVFLCVMFRGGVECLYSTT